VTAPQVSIKDSPPEPLMVLFKIIGRHSWDRLQSWHRSCPGSTIEHVLHGIYVLTVPAGGASDAEAAA
jgi:hypothetical protein